MMDVERSNDNEPVKVKEIFGVGYDEDMRKLNVNTYPRLIIRHFDHVVIKLNRHFIVVESGDNVP